MKGLIFTYVLTYGGAATALFNPFLGLMAYICLSLIKPPSMWFWIVQPGNYSRIVAIAMLIGWGFKGFGQWHFLRAKWIVLALAGFWGWSILSALNAADGEVAWKFVDTMSKILLPFVVGLTLIDSVKKLKILAWVMVFAQGWIAFEMNWSYYIDGYNRAFFMPFSGLDNNSLAIGMVTGVGLAFFLGVGTSKWWAKLLCWGWATLMAHTVMLTFSRGGMLALVVTAIGAFFMLPPKKPKHYVAFALILLLGFRLMGPEVTDRFMSTFADPEVRDASAESRLSLWADNWDVMKKYPILGVGPDHWPLIAHQYGWPAGKEGHSLWLQIGAELGFPGLGFLMMFYGLCIVRSWSLTRMTREVNDPWLRHIGRMVFASFLAFIVSSQFVSLEGLELPYFIALLGAGAIRLAGDPAVASSTTTEEEPLMAGIPPFSPQKV